MKKKSRRNAGGKERWKGERIGVGAEEGKCLLPEHFQFQKNEKRNHPF